MMASNATAGHSKKRDVLDLDSYIEEFFRTQRFDKTKDEESKEIRRLRPDQIEVDLGFKKVIREDVTKPGLEDSDLTDDGPQEAPVLLYKTEFRNSTTGEQEYNISAQRTTTSECQVVVEKGHTIGGEVGITLKLGDIVEAGAGINKEISVNKEVGETIQNEMHWGIDTKITVPKNKRVIAEVNVREKQLTATYDITSTLKGQVVAKFLNTKDNNAMIVCFRESIHKIIEWAKKKYSSAMKHVTVDSTSKTVSLASSVTCKFRYSVQQHVVITEHGIEEE
ncbi:unnamed protein product [Owenia fusiformis]|uniref:Uncharacterized protein n=1 Tax=Owenia fusiformis TaxID=6347 RepID=A0A8S4Q5G2_OWEFU|nr:unnamed protein product [Owenia fusiformis]